MNYEIRHALRNAGIALFQATWNSDVNYTAQRTMGDRSHFYDADTMRYFGCRVSHVDVLHGGVLMVAVMSQKAGYNDSKRVWRYAIHDCSGWTVGEESADYSSRKQAEKALADALKPIKPGAVLRGIIKRKKDEAQATLKALRAIRASDLKMIG